MHGDVAVFWQRVGHEADQSSHFVRVLRHAATADENVARRRLVERRKDAHSRGLARSVRPDKAEYLSAAERKGHMIDRVRFPELPYQIDDMDFHNGSRKCGV